ncbi:MAG TPA: hypothetical protein VGZ29_04130 [Terriglobia bacterium]|nr:hypothetical protein [Terriglobia bacterium]
MAPVNSVACEPASSVLPRPLGAGLRLGLMLGAAAVLLAPIWTVRYPLLIDYPNHLAGAFALAHLKDPAFQLNRFYAADWNVYPYLTMDLILVGLQGFVSIGIAGRLLLSVSVLGVPLAAWFFVRRANPGDESLALWSLLISTNLFFFLYGFLNLQLGLALSLILLGVWLRHAEKPGFALYGALLLLTTLLYFTHLMSFGVAGLVMTFYTLAGRRFAWRQLLLSWILFLPGVTLYLYATWGLHASRSLQFRSFAGKVTGLLVAVLSYSPAIDFATLIVAVAAVVWARTGKSKPGWNRRWIWVTAGLFALYFIFPASYGAGMDADRRLLPFIVIFGLAALRLVPSRARALAAVAAALFLVRGASLEIESVRTQAHLARLADSFRVIPENARVLPVVDWADGGPLVERHFWAYGVIERGWFSPVLFHDPGVQPFAIRAQLYNPYGDAFAGIKSVDWDAVRRDYDYVWSFRSRQFSGQLTAMGTKVFEAGDLEVFRLTHKQSLLVGLSRNSAAKGVR